MLAEKDSENEVRNDNVSEDESDEEFIPDEPTSVIEDNVDTVAKYIAGGEEHNNDESESVRYY